MILNLTQHKATQEQLDQGVVEPGDKNFVQKALTFKRLPSKGEIVYRAAALAEYAEGVLSDRPDEDIEEKAMIGGAPYLMGPLEDALRARCITPVYAFTLRECKETPNPDGSVSKTMIFKHEGFIEV